jgi:signal transduction histidine kinase
VEGNRPLVRPVPVAWTLWGLALVFAAGTIAFTVSDVVNVPGYDALSEPGYVGAMNMEDRLDAVGGRLEMSSTPGSGTRLRAAIPAVTAVHQ